MNANEILVQIYEILERHEKALSRLEEQIEGLVHGALKENPRMFELYRAERNQAARQNASSLDSRVHLIAETIVQLRGSTS